MKVWLCLALRKMKGILFTLLLFVLGMSNSCGQKVEPYFECSSTLNDPYGMCAHFTFLGEKGDNATFAEQSKLISEAGDNIVRFDFTGSTINENNTGTLDNIQPVLKRNRLDYLGIVFDSRLNSKSWDAKNSNFEKQLSIIRKSYLRDCKFLEFHNEVNFCKLPLLGLHYTEDLKKIYNLKKGNKSLKILFSGIGDSHYEFLDSAMRQGAYKYFDIMNFHTYHSPEDIPIVMNTIHDNMVKYGWSKPVWLTECGMHTANYNPTNTNFNFFTKVVPQALRKIGKNIKGLKIGVICDWHKSYTSLNDYEVKEYLTNLGAEPAYLTLEQLKSVEPKQISVIVLTSNESFYSKYFPAVLEFVMNGGTIILPYGAPFYYDLSNGNKGVGKYYANQLHIGQLYWWDNDAKKLKAPEKPSSFSANKSFGVDYSFNSSPRYLTDSKLKGKDKMIPISYEGDDNFMGVVAALYQLNSDLKGNVIIQTRLGTQRFTDLEDEQARRVARIHLIAYAYGIDKVFWYEFRSPEVDPYYSEDNFGMVHKDLSPKPAYYAYKTLIRMLPNGSTRPILNINDGIYKAKWKRPDGKMVTAYWCKNGFTYMNLNPNPGMIIDYMGKEMTLNGNTIKIYSGVTYTISKK